MICKWCLKKITQKIKYDWIERGYHKKCWKSYGEYVLFKNRTNNI